MLWNTYDFGTLFPATAAIFFITALVSFRVTGSVAGALAASLIKAGLFLFYFSVLFDEAYVLRDDQTYIRMARALAAKDVGVFNWWHHIPLLFASAGGPHFGYYIHNIFAFSLFGDGYFAPVALNIILTVMIAVVGSRVAERELGFSGPLGVLFFFYLLLFPDIIAWSTIINDKDISVLLLHVVLLYGFSLWFERRTRSAVLVIIPACFVLLFLRFYVPLFFSIAFFAVTLIIGRKRGRLSTLGAAIVLVGAVVVVLEPARLIGAAILLRTELVNPVTGFIYFLLTPIPLNTETNYAFLDIPATVHWFLMPFAVIGAYKVYELRTPFSKFLLLYFAVFAALYSIFGELQGPRHRVQLDFAWAAFQFAGVFALVREALWTKKPRVEPELPV